MTMHKTAIIYARVSTRRQADEELPLQSQIERCERKAVELGARVIRTFIDGGVSGRADDRPEFQAAIRFCEQHQVDHFITWSTSRFARNVFDSAIYKRRLDKVGARLAYVSCDIDQDTMSGFMMERIMEVFDEAQSRQISEDTQRSMRMNAEAGYWNGGRAPFGYKPVPDQDNPKRKRLCIDESEAEVVREIFDLRSQGSGARAIAQILNEHGTTN
ncbi:MAG TPA: recombinase family protein, partial [Chromatiales bacterium]|nr:recombinase family protein [Chromatiales bacterium]